MNKTAIKIFTFFILLASGISILLLLINFFSFSMTAADTAKIYPESQTKTLSRISEALTYTEDGYILAYETAVPQGSWCILTVSYTHLDVYKRQGLQPKTIKPV